MQLALYFYVVICSCDNLVPLSHPEFPTMLDTLLLGSVGKGKSTTGNKLLNVDGANLSADMVRKAVLKHVWPRNFSGGDQENDNGCIVFDTKPGVAAITQECKVISNAETGFRVMDTRGFAPYDATGNLQIMQEVARSSTELGMKFHRVLYFLPERDIPEKADGNLQEELASLWHFYREKIFKNMLIVVTAPPQSVFDEYDARSVLANSVIDSVFGEGAVAGVQDIFLEALKKVIRGRQARLPPCPRVVFIPFQATSEFVTEIVRNALVSDQNGIRL